MLLSGVWLLLLERSLRLPLAVQLLGEGKAHEDSDHGRDHCRLQAITANQESDLEITCVSLLSVTNSDGPMR